MILLMLPCEAIYATSDSAFYANKKTELYQENEQNIFWNSCQFPCSSKYNNGPLGHITYLEKVPCNKREVVIMLYRISI